MSSGFIERGPGVPMSLRPATGRVRVVFAGETVADSDHAMVMDEDGHQPVYYFRERDVRLDLMSRTAHSSR